MKKALQNATRNNSNQFTLMFQKSRMLQIQGVQGCSCSRLPQIPGNAEDAVLSAFPQGKQPDDFLLRMDGIADEKEKPL